MKSAGRIVQLLAGLAALVYFNNVGRAQSAAPERIEVEVRAARDRQTIDGFGGSLAFWGYDADDAALRVALEDLGASIVRVPGEVGESGQPDPYRDVLRRVALIAPGTRVLVSFWQPRSQAKPSRTDWLDDLGPNGYALKPEAREAWADEIVARLATMRHDWGVNVVAASVQNEPNFSVPGTQTCRWEPEALAAFTATMLAHRLAKTQMPITLAAPDLAYISHEASEARRFLPVARLDAVGIVSYHMYDSYRDGETKSAGFETLRERQQALGRILRAELPAKRAWMTETTGAQWNSGEWHTIGWTPQLDEHDKAVAAARYVHSALVDAGCNAVLWWGLIYSTPPTFVKGHQERQKFRDEGLILVDHRREGSVHPYRERTKKSYAFQQFARFVRPGWVRLEVETRAGRLAAAFRSADGRAVALVLINPDTASVPVAPRVNGARSYRLAEAHVTDRVHRCEPVAWQGSIAAESITTLIFRAED
jgi:glucuronoarabinoxylan endo-1,4-beta-xylanase